MENAVFHDLAMQSMETLRRAAERNMRGLRTLQATEQKLGSPCDAFQQILTDLEADIESLRVLRRIGDELLRQATEAEAFQHFCEGALQTAQLILDETSEAAKIQDGPNGCASEKNDRGRVHEISAETYAISEHFRRLAEWLRTPPPTLAKAVLERLEAMPLVEAPRNGR